MHEVRKPVTCRIDTARIRGVAPRRDGVCPQGETIQPSEAASAVWRRQPTARDVRGAAMRATALLSPRRRFAAVVPLVLALVAWFAIPGEAADFQLDSSGDRYGTISHGIGGHGSYPIHIPGYNHEDAGTLLMHEVGGGDVEAYCIDLRGVRNPSAVFASGERRIDQIAFVLNHDFPAVHGPGQLADLDQEAAAVQLAVWTFSDGVNLDTVSAPSVPGFSTVIARAHQIAAEAAAHWQAWSAQQTAQPVIALRFGAPVAAPGQVALTATVTGGPAGTVPDGTSMVFTVTSPAGTVEGQRTVTSSLAGGSASVQVQASTPGDVTVSARVTINGLAYQQLTPTVRPNQTLILASPLPVTGEASLTTTFPGVPQLVITKAVDTGGAPANAVEAHVGDHLRYTISYANSGTAVAPAATITDDLSQGELSRVAISGILLQGPGATLDPSSRMARWSVGDVPPGASGTVSAILRLPSSLRDSGAGVRFCNIATATTGSLPPTHSNAACAHVPTTPHLVTVKVVDAGEAVPGQTLRYTITVRNDGTRDLDAATITDVLTGSDLDLLGNIRPADGGIYDESTRTVSWNLAPLGSGQSTAVGFAADLPAAGSLPPQGTCVTNVAVASGSTTAGAPPARFPSAPVTTCVHVPVPGGAPPTVPSPPLAVTGTPISVPRTGNGHALVRSAVTGSGLMASGLVVLTGLRRRQLTAWRP